MTDGSTMDGGRTAPAGWYADAHGDGLRYWNGSAWTDQVPPGEPPISPAEDRSRLERILSGVLGACLALFALAVVAVAVKEWDGSLIVLSLNLVLPTALAVGAFASFRSAFRP